VVGGTVLTVALGGLAAALPAQASAGPSAASAHADVAGAAAPRTASPNGLSPHHPVPGIADSLNPGGVTAPDSILSCGASLIAVGGTYAVAVPVGCLTLYYGEWVKVSWSQSPLIGGGGPKAVGVSTELNLQTDGNLVIYENSASTPLWSSKT
jgi:hypothetical protein